MTVGGGVTAAVADNVYNSYYLLVVAVRCMTSLEPPRGGNHISFDNLELGLLLRDRNPPSRCCSSPSLLVRDVLVRYFPRCLRT